MTFLFLVFPVCLHSEAQLYLSTIFELLTPQDAVITLTTPHLCGLSRCVQNEQNLGAN